MAAAPAEIDHRDTAPQSRGRPSRRSIADMPQSQVLSPGRARPAPVAPARPGVAWTLTWLVLAIDAAWLSLGSWTIALRGVVTILVAIAVFHSPLVFRRYRDDFYIRTTVQSVNLLIVFMAASGTLSYLVVSTNAPLIDASLAAWDRALGFDWPACNAWLRRHPVPETVLRFAYASGLLQMIFVVLFLSFTARAQRLEAFLRLFVFATLATVVLSGPFPAAGAWKFFVGSVPAADIASMSHFELLREGHVRHIPLGEMQGLISIPSLHAAMAVLLVHAMRRTLLWPMFVVLDAAMIVSTPVDGGHYFVDVLAGALLAVGLVALEQRRGSRDRTALVGARVAAGSR